MNFWATIMRKSSCDPKAGMTPRQAQGMPLSFGLKKGEVSRRRLKICGRTRQVIAEGRRIHTFRLHLRVVDGPEIVEVRGI